MAETKKNSRGGKSTSGEKKTASTASKKAKPLGLPPEQPSVPLRLITSVAALGTFVLFLVMLLNPDGALVRVLHLFVLGLVGKTCFLVSIPCLLYLFVIQAFSGKRPVRMRSACLLAFALCVGCTAQVLKGTADLPAGVKLLGALYAGGQNGTTAGLICGGLGMLLKWLCGGVISCILLIVGAVLSLSAAIGITIPSLVRAVRNRPRAEWEEEEKKETPEPASVVVNHIANKRIEYVERRRAEAERRANALPPEDFEEGNAKKKAAAFMKEIDGDIEKPVAASKKKMKGRADTELYPLDEGEPEDEEPQAPQAAPVPEPPKKSEYLPENVEKMEEILPVFSSDPVPAAPKKEPPKEPEKEPPVPEAAPQPAASGKVTAKDAQRSAAQVAAEIAQADAVPMPEYRFPPVDLLHLPSRGTQDGTMEMRENSRRLNETLASFKIEAHIINVTRGPSVTRYEVELEKGVRLNKLTSCADDIALSLGASGVRIAAVPGKISVVGIEVPNRAVTTVTLREVVDSTEFRRAKSRSSFAVGKDIGGSCIVGNIAKLPHMLIAGTTGSGKSVCMNSIIISLLYKASPQEVKLIMVDPKMVELGIYNGIPHLLIPVVTDPKKAAGSLQWAVTEMMRRYKTMSDAGVRDLESYNSIVESQEIEGQKLPQVVVIIDELADLMLVAAKEVEESICRIAQMGRAAGIHLIIATQRPSADVITGLMKANIPSRIAFAVSSAMESRIILDTQGAEKLVGRGDMLYAPIGIGKPLRVQGCFVSDPEVEAVATYVKENFITDYDQGVIEEIEKKAAQSGSKSQGGEPEPSKEELEGDEMLPAAVDVILETGQASVSMLQRRLKLGYARAARIVDEMEERGIVGPFQGSKPRAILVTKEQWSAMRSGEGEQLSFGDVMDDGVPEELD